ncbi:hypothetical protein Zmor_026316 [Zophobas morio]|uniref:Uncharacterized protein n=1 Tax=Zophobas morio TaxID=2755281 RepID=A0AA38HTF6_9CUCU|nr:hypothetical protein Zmor_026316 [Zophobas morio]
MNTNRYPRGLPPQYPYTRRGSNTPVASVGLAVKPPLPNRSRSLDGLLDSEPPSAAPNATITEKTPSDTTKSCDDLDKDKETEDEFKVNSVKSQSMDNNLDNVDKVSIQSGSSDSKRKRNFMDRCVSKVRSLIKK